MSSTIRKLILENIKTTIEGISSIKTVYLHEFDHAVLEKAALPVAFVAPEDNDTIEYEDRWAVWTMPVSIEVWGKGLDLEDYIGEIYQALLVDITRGGYAEQTKRLSGTILMLYDGLHTSVDGLSIMFEITYRHLIKNPYSQDQE